MLRTPPHLAELDGQDDRARHNQRRPQYAYTISDVEQTIEDMRKRVPSHHCPYDHVPIDLEVPLKLQIRSTTTWRHCGTLCIIWRLQLWFTTSPLFPDGRTLEFSERSQFREESVDLVGVSALLHCSI